MSGRVIDQQWNDEAAWALAKQMEGFGAVQETVDTSGGMLSETYWIVRIEHFNALADALSAQRRQDDVAELETIKQRDEAEDALSRMFQAVTGKPAEWSSDWHYEEAIEEVDAHIAGLQNQQLANMISEKQPRQDELSAPPSGPLFSAVVRARTSDEEVEACRALARAVNADLDRCLSDEGGPPEPKATGGKS